jgi:hypothetical protein
LQEGRQVLAVGVFAKVTLQVCGMFFQGGGYGAEIVSPQLLN